MAEAPGVADRDAVMAKAAGENFPVALPVLPRRVRAHLGAIYGYARLVDDAGDEAPGDRLAHLDALEADLARIWRRQAPEHPVLQALVPTVRELRLAPEPFLRLLAANRQDQKVRRYRRWRDLSAYCELSANPVGHLVLHVFGAATPPRLRLSDDVCTALQLVEHCQDVAEDLRRDRVYLPAEDLARFGCDEGDLARAPASSAVRELLAFEVSRARVLLDRGAPLVATLRWPARLAVAGYVGGGRAATDAIAAAGHDVLSATHKPRRRRVALQLARALVRGR